MVHTVLLALAIPAVLLSACGSDDPATTCGAENATQACVCSDGSTGGQTCLASGEWGACQCATSDTTGGDATQADVAGDTSPTPDGSVGTVIEGCTDSGAANF